MTVLSERKDTQTLQDIEFFKLFSADAVAKLKRAATLRKYKKNHHIIVLGEDSLSVYVLLNGSAYAFVDDDDGNELILSTLNEGDCFGELGFLDNQARTSNVKTTSECECLVVPGAEINHEILKDPETARAIINFLVKRIRGMTDEISCLGLMDVYGRLVRVLNNASAIQEDGRCLTSRVTHQELASRVGSSREMVSKLLKELRTGGFISIENHRVCIRKNLPERW